MPKPNRRVAAKMTTLIFDGDRSKATVVRARIAGAVLVRRNRDGDELVRNELARDRGEPDK